MLLCATCDIAKSAAAPDKEVSSAEGNRCFAPMLHSRIEANIQNSSKLHDSVGAAAGATRGICVIEPAEISPTQGWNRVRLRAGVGDRCPGDVGFCECDILTICLVSLGLRVRSLGTTGRGYAREAASAQRGLAHGHRPVRSRHPSVSVQVGAHPGASVAGHLARPGCRCRAEHQDNR